MHFSSLWSVEQNDGTKIVRERMYDMMRLLVEKSLQGSNILNNEHELSLVLETHGFQQDEIYDAITWVQQILGDRGDQSENYSRSGKGTAIRVLHPEERLAFSPAAHGLIHRLFNSGVIDDYVREEIIQRCIDLAAEEIGLEEVRTITLLILLKDRRDTLSENVMDILGVKKVRSSK